MIGKIKKIELEKSNLIVEKIFSNIINVYNPDKINETYLISIKRNKTQENYWLFNGNYKRKLYTRLKNSYIKGVFPEVV